MNDSLEDRVRRLESRDAMYGPIRLGGPCPKCGLAQFEHRMLSCEDAMKERLARIERDLRPIINAALRSKGETHGNHESKNASDGSQDLRRSGSSS